MTSECGICGKTDCLGECMTGESEADAIERVAAAMWDASHWSPEMPTFAHDFLWGAEWPDGYDGLRDMIRTQARAAIAEIDGIPN